MSVYFIKGKGWRYDFTLKGNRYTAAWFPTKKEAKYAESEKRRGVRDPQQDIEIPIDMAFSDLAEKRLDYLEAYSTTRHYRNNVHLVRKWIREWGKFTCDEISRDMVQEYLFKRKKVSASTANYDLRHLRALFNYGVEKGWIPNNPTKGIRFFPVEKKVKYIPPPADVIKVLLASEPDSQDYLNTIKETMGRMGEINRLTWTDVNFAERYVILYTRKKRGGDLTPRKVPMTDKLFDILTYRYSKRDKSKPWVFWHRYWSRKEGGWVEGPYTDRNKMMKTLCRKAWVKYFRYHPLRHLGASQLDNANVNIGSIQRILGHENRKKTEIYLHSLGEAEREAMKIFEQVQEKSHTDSHTEQGTTKLLDNSR